MTTWPAHQASLTDLFCLRFAALPAHPAPAKPQKHFPDLTVKKPDTGTIHKLLQPQTVSQSRAASRILHRLRGSSTFVYFDTGHMRKLHGSSPQLRPAVRDQLLELSTSIGQLTKEWVFVIQRCKADAYILPLALCLSDAGTTLNSLVSAFRVAAPAETCARFGGCFNRGTAPFCRRLSRTARHLGSLASPSSLLRRSCRDLASPCHRFSAPRS